MAEKTLKSAVDQKAKKNGICKSKHLLWNGKVLEKSLNVKLP